MRTIGFRGTVHDQTPVAASINTQILAIMESELIQIPMNQQCREVFCFTNSAGVTSKLETDPRDNF